MNQEIYTREKTLWTVLIPQMILMVISILWICLVPGDNIARYLKFNLQALFIGSVTGVSLSFLGYVFYKWAKRKKRFLETIELFENVLSPAFKNFRIIEIILLSLVSGFCEEIFFRGLLQPKFGILIASLAFGSLHLPGLKYWIYALWATLSGALFGLFFILANSLWFPITAHAVNNIMGMILLTKVKK